MSKWLEAYVGLVAKIRNMMIDIFLEQQRLGRSAERTESMVGRQGAAAGADHEPFQLRRSQARLGGGGERMATTIEESIQNWFMQREWRRTQAGTPWLAILASLWPKLKEEQRGVVLKTLGDTEVQHCSMRTLVTWGIQKCKQVLTASFRADDVEQLLRKVPNRAALRYAGVTSPLACLGCEAVKEGDVEHFREALAEAGYVARTASGPTRALPWDAAIPCAWRTRHGEATGEAAGWYSIFCVRKDCKGIIWLERKPTPAIDLLGLRAWPSAKCTSCGRVNRVGQALCCGCRVKVVDCICRHGRQNRGNGGHAALTRWLVPRGAESAGQQEEHAPAGGGVREEVEQAGAARGSRGEEGAD